MCFKINKQIIYFESRASHYVIFEMADRQKSRKSGLRLMLSLTDSENFLDTMVFRLEWHFHILRKNKKIEVTKSHFRKFFSMMSEVFCGLGYCGLGLVRLGRM